MRSIWTVSALLIGFVLISAAGCVFTPSLDRIQRMVAEQIEPATMKTEVKLNLGPVAISAAKFVTRFAHVEEEVQDYLTCIDRVELNVQRISGLSSLRSLRWPKGIEKKLRDDGWEILVKAREDEEIVMVLYKTRKSSIRSMYVLVLNTEELVLVKVDGELDTLAMQAIENHGCATEWTADIH